MKIKDVTIKELESLKPVELLIIYDMILSLKKKSPVSIVEKSLLPYIKVKEALTQCKGALSDDIIEGREDRI